MWLSTDLFRPEVTSNGQNRHVWLYDIADPDRGPFVGSYSTSGDEERCEIESYVADERSCYPTHFWDAEGEPPGGPEQ